MPLFNDPTFLLLIPAFLLALWAQSMVKSAYKKYSRMPTQKGIRAAEAVTRMLHDAGNHNVGLERVPGALTDHYNPKTEVLSLSEEVYNSSSVAAVAVAAHEAGHAMQKHEGYAPLGLRSAIVPVVNIGSSLSMPIFILGIVMSFQPLVWAGIVLFSLAVLFALITLPTEFNASSRAIRMLTTSGIITTPEEERGAKAMLRAAAMTYVANAIGAMLQLLRLILIAGNSRSRD